MSKYIALTRGLNISVVIAGANLDGDIYEYFFLEYAQHRRAMHCAKKYVWDAT